jgi:putative restriction endonuclease
MFWVLVTEAYERRCSITGERTLPGLQASHIKPFSQEGEHRVSNGLLLRADLHILFDQGVVTVTPEHEVLVSDAIRERFENGRDYYVLRGQKLKVVPSARRDQPDPELLRWHNVATFVA